jgi:hypothetical protein
MLFKSLSWQFEIPFDIGDSCISVKNMAYCAAVTYLSNVRRQKIFFVFLGRAQKEGKEDKCASARSDIWCIAG